MPPTPMPIDTSESTVARLASTLSNRLLNESKRKRIPRGFNNARATAAKTNVTATTQAEQTGQIFLKAGLQAFLAYQLASSGYGNHHKGQNKEREAVKSIKNLPPAHQELIAERVASADVHPNVSLLLNRLSEPSPNYRRERTNIAARQTPEYFRPESYRDEDVALTPVSVSGTTNSMLEETIDDVQPSGARHNTNELDRPQLTLEATATLVASDATQEIASPPAKNLPKVYPNHICRAIRKIGDKAAIEMAFPYIRYKQSFCLMTLSIQANKVAHFAMILFGVHIECDDQSRYMVIDGVRVEASDWSLQGVKWDTVTEFFGLKCSEGVNRCPMRRKEVEEGEDRTACVTMRVTNRANEDAFLSLSIAIESGFEVKEVLFGE